MKNKIPLLLILSLVLINLFSGSCKKDNDSNIPHLLTSGKWQLASVLVYNYLGDAQLGDPDTLYADCLKPQFFVFNTDNTCTYTAFDCIDQTTNGPWELTENRLYFKSTMACKDTVAGGKTVIDSPFVNTQIYNLGTYSMVLQTGNVEPNYSANQRRTIKRYGFIRQKAVTSE
jgi:hypothetical protein